MKKSLKPIYPFDRDPSDLSDEIKEFSEPIGEAIIYYGHIEAIIDPILGLLTTDLVVTRFLGKQRLSIKIDLVFSILKDIGLFEDSTIEEIESDLREVISHRNQLAHSVIPFDPVSVLVTTKKSSLSLDLNDLDQRLKKAKRVLETLRALLGNIGHYSTEIAKYKARHL